MGAILPVTSGTMTLQEGSAVEYQQGDAVEVDRSRVWRTSSTEPANSPRLPDWVPAVVTHVQRAADSRKLYRIHVPDEFGVGVLTHVFGDVLRRRR